MKRKYTKKKNFKNEKLAENDVKSKIKHVDRRARPGHQRAIYRVKRNL